MEQATRTRAHIERIMLICGDQNAGKSRLLRHMLGDARLGGNVPSSARVGARHLSRERCLAVRVTSPHETNGTPAVFHSNGLVREFVPERIRVVCLDPDQWGMTCNASPRRGLALASCIG